MSEEPERSERLPCPVGVDVLKELMQMKEVGSVTAKIFSYKTEEAVAIIDNLDQLAAAIVLADIRILAYCNSPVAKKVVERADELRIRGTAGLIYARDKVYHDTGYFAGI